MMMKSMLWGLVLVVIMFSLTACGATPSVQQETTTAMEVVSSPGTSEGATTAPVVSESVKNEGSDWVTGVISGEVELTQVVEFAGGLIGSNSMALYYSKDGIDWELTKDLSPFPFYAIFPVGGQMVVYDASTAHATLDGKNWSSSPRDDYHMFHAVMHDDERYIKVDTSQLYTSEDGEKFWPVQSDPANALTQVVFLEEDGKPTSIGTLARYNGIYYAAGPGLWTSTDLLNWTKVVTMNEMTYGAENLLYNGSVFFMPAYYENYVYDGSSIIRVKPIGNTFLVHEGKFTAVSGTGASSISVDGITWEPLFSEDASPFQAYTSIVFDGKLFAYGEAGHYRYAELEE